MALCLSKIRSRGIVLGIKARRLPISVFHTSALLGAVRRSLDGVDLKNKTVYLCPLKNRLLGRADSYALKSHFYETMYFCPIKPKCVSPPPPFLNSLTPHSFSLSCLSCSKSTITLRCYQNEPLGILLKNIMSS